MQIKQEVVHLGSPRLVFLFSNSGTVSHEMGTTNAVSTPISIIAGESVVHPSTSEAGPDANLVHSQFASGLMPGQMGEPGGTVDMEPMQHPVDANTRFISMHERTGSKQIGYALHCRSQAFCARLTPMEQGRFPDLAPTDRFQCFAGTC